MPYKVFVSHTRLDKDTCDRFDIAAARVGIEVFRSEYESIKPPAWETIINNIRLSSALFLLVGPQLVESQKKAEQDWKFTQNWIAYEVGVACERKLNVWVFCDGVEINFPVPYLDNYYTGRIEPHSEGFVAKTLSAYLKAGRFAYPYSGKAVACKSKECGAKFNLWGSLAEGASVICPTCLKPILFKYGWR